MKQQTTLEFVSFLLFSSFLFLAFVPLLLKVKNKIGNVYESYYVASIGSKIAQFISSYCDSYAELRLSLLNSTKILARDSQLYVSYKNYEQVFPIYCSLNFSIVSQNSNYSIKTKFGEVVISKLNS